MPGIIKSKSFTNDKIIYECDKIDNQEMEI